MLYHGRECYRKNSQLILFNFYKNLLLVLPQLWYGFSNSFSSANIYDPWIYQLYNVLYTSFPIAVFAIYDLRFTRDQSLADPALYSDGLHNTMFNLRRVAIWFVLPVFFSYFLSTLTFVATETTVSSGGYMFDLIGSGMSIFGQCVIICNLRILTISFKYSYGLLLFVFLGISLYWITMAISSTIFPTSETANLISVQARSLEYWLLIFQNCSIVVLIEMAIMQWRVLGEQALSQRKQTRAKQDIEMPILSKDLHEDM